MTGPNRVDVLLDPAIEVVAAEGLRGLTHRAVDARAGLSAGSTSYYYRTRIALLEAVLGQPAGLVHVVARRDPAAVPAVGGPCPRVHGAQRLLPGRRPARRAGDGRRAVPVAGGQVRPRQGRPPPPAAPPGRTAPDRGRRAGAGVLRCPDPVDGQRRHRRAVPHQPQRDDVGRSHRPVRPSARGVPGGVPALSRAPAAARRCPRR